MSDTADIAATAAEAAQLAKADLNFLGAITEPETFSLLFPAYYISLFALLTSFKNKYERYAVGLPRGFAKTTFMKLLVVWCVLFSSKKFILIVGAAEDLAINTLSDIMDMLGAPNIRALFGDWDRDVYVDQSRLKVFSFRGRTIILRAIGANSSVRGINRKNSRPDLIIMDDIQKKEDAENPELATALMNWMTGTLMKAKSNFDCTYIFVGNMYPRNSILEKLKNASTWTSLIVGGILADGSSLWEELRPIEELLLEYQADVELGQGEIFCSEVLNSTDLLPPSGLDVNSIPQPPHYLLTTEPEGSFILIDPSSGKKQGDDCTINHISVIDGIPLLDTVLFGTFSPIEVIKQAIGLAIENDTRLICVEDVAYQSTLLFWFNYYCEQEGYSGFEFRPVSPKARAKNNRIKLGLIKLLKGEGYLHPNVRSLFIDQAKEWNPAKTTNRDDIIDPWGYVEEVMQNYEEEMTKRIFESVDSASATHYLGTF
jgi:hypothetical protein